MSDNLPPPQDESTEARRNFLKRAGQFAIYTPPAMLMLMHPSRKAIAQTLGKQKGNNGIGNGFDPPPNGKPFQPGGKFPVQNDEFGRTLGNPAYKGGGPKQYQ
jgi:hypothetical protein